jgi:hypothetical protein
LFDVEALARVMKNDARNIRDVFYKPWSWQHATLTNVVTGCAMRLIEAEDNAPELVEEARANLREAVTGYKRLMGWI